MPHVEDQDLMRKYQADILTQKTTDNPYIVKSPIAARNQQLKTKITTVTGVINEIDREMKELDKTVTNRLNERLEILGNYGLKPEILTELRKIDSSAIEAILRIYKDINGDNMDTPEDISKIAPSMKEAILKMSADIEEVSDKVVNYKESFVVKDGEPYSQFKLRYVPIEESIRLQVNGVTYDCAYLPDQKCVEWIFTDANGGFDLDSTYSVNVFYDYLKSEQKDEEI